MGLISNTTTNAIDGVMLADKSLTAEEIKDLAGLNIQVSTVRRALGQLIEEGRAVREGTPSRPLFRKLEDAA